MVSTISLFTAVLATAAATASAQTEAGLPYTLGKPTFFGSGCPANTVGVVSSTDGKTISVLFSEFGSKTTPARMRQYKSCSLAVPLDVKPVRSRAFLVSPFASVLTVYICIIT
jgi:hypothetical protein